METQTRLDKIKFLVHNVQPMHCISTCSNFGHYCECQAKIDIENNFLDFSFRTNGNGISQFTFWQELPSSFLSKSLPFRIVQVWCTNFLGDIIKSKLKKANIARYCFFCAYIEHFDPGVPKLLCEIRPLLPKLRFCGQRTRSHGKNCMLDKTPQYLSKSSFKFVFSLINTKMDHFH